MMDLSDVITTGGVPLIIAIAGWIKASQSTHASRVTGKLDLIQAQLSDYHARISVVEAILRIDRPPSFLPPGKTRETAANN